MKRLLADPVTNATAFDATNAALPWLKGKGTSNLSALRKSQPSPPPLDPAQLTADSLVDLDDDADYYPTKADQPRQPDGARSLKPSKLNQIRKAVGFQPYKSTRPDLLEQLNLMVAQGMRSITSTSAGNEHDEEKLFLIYSTAFQVFVNESTLYQRFLMDVKSSYDGYVSLLLESLNKATSQSNVLANHEAHFEGKLKEAEAEKHKQIKQLTVQLRETELRCAQLEQDKQRLQSEHSALQTSTATIRKEHSELKATCAMLTSSLSRMEEEFRNYQAAESTRGLEVTGLRATEQKLIEEIERLQLVVQNNEQVLGLMVGHDVVSALENTVTMLREELKRMELTHRQLLLRYASLKAAVDESFAKHERSQTAQHQSKEKVEEAVREALHPSSAKRKHNNELPTDPVGKVLYIVEKGMGAKLLVEVMLDQIAQRQTTDRTAGQSGPFLDFSQSHSGTNAAEGSSTLHTVTYEGDEGMTASEDFRSPWVHFDGLGYEDCVPSYLRFNGKIQNLCFSRKEIVTILTELWDAKSAFDAQLANIVDSNAAAASKLTDVISETNAASSAVSDIFDKPGSSRGPSAVGSPRARRRSSNANGGRSSLISQSLLEIMPLNPKFSTFIEYYLKDKFKNNVVLATEMYYNILDALKRFATLSDCKLFTVAFEEKMPFEIKSDMQGMLDMLQDESIKECKLVAGVSDGPAVTGTLVSFGGAGVGNATNYRLTMDQMIRLLRRIFPSKSDQSFGKLSKALILDCQNTRVINVDELLVEDFSGSRSHFLEQIRLQHLAETIAFEKHVLDAIDQCADANEKEVTVGKFREAIVHADPNKPRSEVNQWLARGCASSIEETLLMEAKRSLFSTADFKRNLKAVLLKRSPPPARAVK